VVWRRGTMALKRVSSHKTNAGYAINIFVKDGKHVKPLLAVIEKYFQWARGETEDERKERIRLEVEHEAKRLKSAYRAS